MPSLLSVVVERKHRPMFHVPSFSVPWSSSPFVSNSSPTRGPIPNVLSLVCNDSSGSPCLSHPMITWSKSGIQKPNPKYALTINDFSLPSMPTSVDIAMKDPQ